MAEILSALVIMVSYMNSRLRKLNMNAHPNISVWFFQTTSLPFTGQWKELKKD